VLKLSDASMSLLKKRFSEEVASLRAANLYRHREGIDDATLNFASNDYLSLTKEPAVQQIYQRAFARFPCGSGASSLGFAYHANHRALECAFAEALGVDDALLFSSGYAANLSVAHLLKRFQLQALIDKAVHASIYDGLQGNAVPLTRYLHNDLEDLQLKTQSLARDKATILITEAVFSMSGQCAPLAQIHVHTAQHVEGMVVDEAHAFGILGREGLGAVMQQGLSMQAVPLRVIPLGKACAAAGAVVAGDGLWIDALLQCARPYIYSTAISPAMAYGLLEILNLLREADARRAKLQALVEYFRQAVAQSPLTWRDSRSPIQQLQLATAERALDYAQYLRQQGIVVLATRQPTVSKKETGLRVVLNYHHEPDDIDFLFQCLAVR
jgi:8-amino-7-oxononanoate synthase